MLQRLRQLQYNVDGGLTFEWILLATVVVLGIVGGLTAARDALLSELGDIAGAVLAVDQSYTGFCTSWTDTQHDVIITRPTDNPGP